MSGARRLLDHEGESAIGPPIVFYGEYTASLSLYLDGLEPGIADKIAILHPSNLAKDFVRLASAGLVIYVRGFENVVRSGLDAALARLDIPRAWFSDDDLRALHGEQPGFRYYSEARIRQFAGQMVGLVATTPILRDRLAHYHPQVLLWPCVFDEALVPRPLPDRRERLRVGVIGGDFRRSGLRDLVLPALAGLPNVELVLAEPIGSGIPNAQLVAFEPDFRRFVATWRAAAIDVIAHPPGRSQNMHSKGAGVLLAALYLGAVPVVADEAAFAGLGSDDGVIRIGAADPSQWREAFERLANPDHRDRCFAKLAAYCRNTFKPEDVRPTVEHLLQRAAPMGSAAQGRRRLALQMAWRPRRAFAAANAFNALLASIRSR